MAVIGGGKRMEKGSRDEGEKDGGRKGKRSKVKGRRRREKQTSVKSVSVLVTVRVKRDCGLRSIFRVTSLVRLLKE
jgi:hypothetical protein